MFEDEHCEQVFLVLSLCSPSYATWLFDFETRPKERRMHDKETIPEKNKSNQMERKKRSVWVCFVITLFCLVHQFLSWNVTSFASTMNFIHSFFLTEKKGFTDCSLPSSFNAFFLLDVFVTWRCYACCVFTSWSQEKRFFFFQSCILFNQIMMEVSCTLFLLLFHPSSLPPSSFSGEGRRWREKNREEDEERKIEKRKDEWMNEHLFTITKEQLNNLVNRHNLRNFIDYIHPVIYL